MNETAPENRTMGPGAVIGAMLMCVVFGANIVAIKISLRGMGPLTAAGIRFALAAAAIAAWALVTRRSFALKKGQLSQLGSNAVYIKRIISEYKAFQIAFYPIAFITPFLFAAAFILEDPAAVHLDWPVTCALVYQGIVSAGAGFVVWNVLQKRYGVVTLHSFIFLVPVSGVTFSALVLDEAVTGMNFIVSLVLITLGILLVNAGVGKKKRP